MITADELPLIVQALAGEEPAEVERLAGSGNNLVARVQLREREVVAKAYFHSEGDPRDRVRHEFDLLRHLWGCGVRAIPEPLAVDYERRVALYGYCPGEVPSAESLTGEDVDALLDLLLAVLRLSELAADPPKRALPRRGDGRVVASVGRLHQPAGAAPKTLSRRAAMLPVGSWYSAPRRR